MRRNQIFEEGLKLYNLTKKEFALKTKIPYNTVAGWKRNDNVPGYAFELLKRIAYMENRMPETAFKKIKPQINQELLKKVQVAFWGKDIDPEDVIKKARRGNKEYLTTIVNNIWTKDVVRLLGPKNILRHLPKNSKIPKEKIDDVLHVARVNI